MKSKNNWFNFQEEICSHFISLGVNAKTNVRLNGIRTNHDIDILVETKFLGQNIKWIIEAKYWKNKVSKLHVLALRTIIDEIGADKGFIISEKGFQKGAIEAIKNTNIVLKTFDELVAESKVYIELEILKTYENRFEIIDKRYWSHCKRIRMKYGLRGERGEIDVTFSVHFILQSAKRAIRNAILMNYPICLDTHLLEKHGDFEAENFQQLINWLNLNLNVVDSKILEAEIQMLKNDDFDPIYKI